MRKCFVVFVILLSAAPAAVADLEVYLPMDGTLSDASGNGHHGSLVNGANGTNGFVAAQVGDGLDLGMIDESQAFLEATKTGGDYVSIDYTLPDTGTIAMWYHKIGGFTYNFETLWDVSGTTDHPWDNWECWFDKTATSTLWFRGADGEDGRWGEAEVKVKTPDLYPGDFLDRWYHVAITWEKTSADRMAMTMYVDGEVADDNPTAWWQASGSVFYLGGGNDGNTYGVGVWDEVAIWNNRLDATQVSNVYNDGVLAWDMVGIPGDLNSDGAVNSGDLDIVRGAWGESVDPGCLPCGDPSGDGLVNSSDLDIIRANWGRTGAASAVPEPAALLLIVCGLGVALARRRRA